MDLIFPNYKQDSFSKQITAVIVFLAELQRINEKEDCKLDLSELKFLHPFTALVLSASLLRIKESNNIEIVSPKNGNLRSYIDAIKLNDCLNINSVDQIVKLNEYSKKDFIPITKFPTEDDKDSIKIAEEALDLVTGIMRSRLDLNIEYFTGLKYVISELTTNISEHSESPEGWIFSQFYPKKNFFDICILDRGKTIHQSYLDNKFDHKNDNQSIRAAVDGISTKGEERGMGIPTTSRMVIRGLSGNFLILSGGGLYFNKNFYKFDSYFKGTIIAIRINKDIKDFKYIKYVE